MTPMPPDCAMAMAMVLSVTVSMAEESSGMPSSIVGCSLVWVSVCVGQDGGGGGLQQDVVESKSLADFMP